MCTTVTLWAITKHPSMMEKHGSNSTTACSCSLLLSAHLCNDRLPSVEDRSVIDQPVSDQPQKTWQQDLGCVSVCVRVSVWVWVHVCVLDLVWPYRRHKPTHIRAHMCSFFTAFQTPLINIVRLSVVPIGLLINNNMECCWTSYALVTATSNDGTFWTAELVLQIGYKKVKSNTRS